MRLAVLLALTAMLGAAETSLEVKWKKAFRADQAGTLRITADGLEFRPGGKNAPERSWAYADIQHFDRIDKAEVEIRSYEDSQWRMGRDRRYRFAVLAGEFGDDLLEQVVSRIGKPATNRVAATVPGAELELPAKHLRRWGSSQGVLFVDAERIVYASPSPRRSREWLLGRDVDAIWSSDPFRLEVHAFDGRDGYLRQPSVYRFALKRPLDREAYRRLKLKIYELGREPSAGH